MKKFTLLIALIIASGFLAMTQAQVDVTFRVDMANEMVSGEGVHIAGSFQSWDPAATVLTQVEASSVFAVTISLEEGNFEYKFINGNAWGSEESVPNECNQNGNRYIAVGTEPMTLDVVCFGSCEACTQMVDVTFQVDMANESVPGPVNIAGNFQNWDPAATAMTLDHDAVYTYTTSIAAGYDLEYKFINGDNWDGAESVPACCRQNGNRYLTVPETDVVIDLVCFGRCVECGIGGDVEVTIQVDMSNQEISAEGVHIAGNFQNWQPGDTPMTDAGNGIYTHTFTANTGDCVEYKFINGNIWDYAEIIPGDCSVDGNRYFLPGDVDEILDPVCFGECEPCSGGTEDLLISEYAEGSGNNKYVEIYNGTGAAVDLSAYNMHRISNGGSWVDGYIYPLSGILDDGDVYVIANSSADSYILERADETSTLTYFNGDDAVGLSKNDGDSWTMIDVVGEEGPDPGSGWEVAGVSNATKNHTLIRKSDVCLPNADWAVSAGSDAADSEWIVEAEDYWSELGQHSAVCGGTPVAVMPAFSKTSGTYFNFFDLEISCETTGAVIYYTTDGTEPDNSATEYTAPINMNSGTTVKAIAYAPGYQKSFVAEVSYAFEQVIQVSNIAELRALWLTKDDVYYQITGEVILTFQQDWRGQKYIQDNSAAVLIDDNSGVITTEYAIGDGITGIIGTLNEYGNMLQFTPAIDPGDATSTGNVIVPEVITLDEMNNNFEEYEAELVTIEGVTFNDLGYFFINGKTYDINDGSKAQAVFRTTFYDVDYIEELMPQNSCDITGLCNSRFDGDYITSRSIEDFSVTLPDADIAITEIMYNPPNNDDFYEFVEIYNNGTSMVNLEDWEFTEGVSLTFPDHLLAPGEYVVASPDSDEFFTLFGVESYQFSGALSNGGEDVELSDPFGNAYDYVDYDNGGDWCPMPDGEGPSLTFCDPSLDNSDPLNWSVSTYLAAVNEGEGFYCTPGAGCNESPALAVFYEEGWNGISSNLLPDNKMLMDDLFAQAEKNTVILVGQDGIFWPGQNINTIGAWDTYEGYKVKFDGDTYFVFPGEELTDRTVELEPGLYYVPVLSEESVAVQDVIVPLGDTVEFMFDIKNGGVYWPEGGIVPGGNGALETLTPGFAYLTRINSTVTIDYAIALTKTAVAPIAKVNNTTWNDVTVTGEQHIISVTADALNELQEGDVLGIFNGQGTCAGMTEYNGKDQVLSLVVYGDDQLTGEIDGMAAMEAMNVKVFRNGEVIDMEAVYNLNLKDNKGQFVVNGLSMMTGLKLGATGINNNDAAYSIYPNPANGQFHIDIQGSCLVEITNAQGQLIRSAEINGNSLINLGDQPEGIYFIKLSNETSTMIERMIIK